MARLAVAWAAAGLARGSTRGLDDERGNGCEPWAAPLGHARGGSSGMGAEFYTVWAREAVRERGAHILKNQTTPKYTQDEVEKKKEVGNLEA